MTATISYDIPHVRVTIDENAIQSGAVKVLEVIRPTWNKDEIEFKLLTDGITNKLVGCKLAGLEEEETILIRVYGKKTDLIIDRDTETKNILFLNKINLAPDLFATFENGLAYKYIPGRTMNVESIRDRSKYILVAKRMAQLHKAGYSEREHREPLVWKKLQNFFCIIPDEFSEKEKQTRFSQLCFSKQKIAQEIEEMKEKLEKLSSPIIFAHNDLLLGNIIYTEKTDTVTFIDYEYAGYNYQAFDIGNHFAEFVGLDEIDYSNYPTKKLQFDWLEIYLTEFNAKPPTKKEIEKLYVEVNQFSLLTHLFWASWSLIQAEHSNINFDYLGYAAIRLNEYFAKKDQFLALRLPNE